MWENMFYFFPASLSKSKLKLVLHTVDARNLASEMFNPCQLVQDFFHQTIWDGEWRMDLFFLGGMYTIPFEVCYGHESHPPNFNIHKNKK